MAGRFRSHTPECSALATSLPVLVTAGRLEAVISVEIMTSGRPQRLDMIECRLNGVWSPLPDWARFFDRVGVFLALRSTVPRPCTIALVLPSRTMAAPLTLTAYTLTRHLQRPATDPAERFWNEILEYEHAFPVRARYLTGAGKLMTTTILRAEIYEGHGPARYGVWIRDVKEQERFVFLDQCRRIEVLVEDNGDVNPTRPHRTSPRHTSTFVEAVVGRDGSGMYAFEEFLECVVCGNRRRLKTELLDEIVSCRSSEGEVVEGNLQDLVRVKQWVARGAGYRSVIVSPGAMESRLPPDTIDIPVVLFDGPLGFIRLAHNWPNSTTLVLLSHADTATPEAVDRIRGEQLSPVARDLDMGTLGHFPRGVEGQAFEIVR